MNRFLIEGGLRFALGALGDMFYRAANGNYTAIGGTKAEGKAPVIQADGTVAWGQTTGAFVPTFIADDETFTVPANRQALFAIDIDNEGTLEINGFLIQVD
jgi:hypothetical protein